MRRVWLTVGILGACVVCAGWYAVSARSQETKATGPAPVVTLQQIVDGKAEIVDLTYALNSQNPYWPAENYEPFRLKSLATIEKNGVLSKSFSCPEHLGTHLDAPNHFEKNRLSVAEIPSEHFFAPGVVLDISPKAGADADATLSLADIHDWEATHGRIPDHAVVLLNTGWGRFWNNDSRFKNQDLQGRLHFPSYSAAAAGFLVAQRHIRGLGVDTLSIDPGLSKDFAVHHLVNAAERYGLENVANLEKLPPRDFYVIVAPIKIETGTGGPCRIFAVRPQSITASSHN